MAPRKKTATGAAPKKRTRSTAKPKTTTRKTKSSKSTTAKSIKPVEEIAPIEQQQTPTAPTTELLDTPSYVMVDGDPVAIRGIAPPGVLEPVAQPSPATQPMLDEQERARQARLQEKIRARELRRQKAQQPAAMSNPPPVAPVPVAPPAITPLPTVTAPPPIAPPPAPQLDVQQAAEMSPQTSVVPQPAPQVQAPEQPQTISMPALPSIPTKVENKPDLKLQITELPRLRIQVAEQKMRMLSGPIRAKLKAQAEIWLKDAINQSLAQNEEYMKVRREAEVTINGLLTELTPQLPEGYAVVVVDAQHGEALCRYAPDQVGKRFKID